MKRLPELGYGKHLLEFGERLGPDWFQVVERRDELILSSIIGITIKLCPRDWFGSWVGVSDEMLGDQEFRLKAILRTAGAIGHTSLVGRAVRVAIDDPLGVGVVG